MPTILIDVGIFYARRHTWTNLITAFIFFGARTFNLLVVLLLQMSDDVHAQISSAGVSVEYRYPNSNVNRLHFKVWKQLLSRYIT